MAKYDISLPFARKPIRIASAAALAAAMLFASPAFAANRDMVQLQTQVQQLQNAVARLQQVSAENMGVLKDLVQQSADTANKMSANMDDLKKQMLVQQNAQNLKVDQGAHCQPRKGAPEHPESAAVDERNHAARSLRPA